MTKIPDDVVERALSVKTEECPEGLQYVLIRGLHAIGFKLPASEAEELARAACQIAYDTGRRDEREEFTRSIDYRMNERLCEMKPDYDDSITGFNEAWNIAKEAIRTIGE